MTIALLDSHRSAARGQNETLTVALRLYRTAIMWMVVAISTITISLAVISLIAPHDSFGPTVLGRKFLVVRSGSMQPTFGTGSVVVMKQLTEAEARSLTTGEIVAYRSLANPDILITHRIIQRITPLTASAVSTDAQYITKGDANVAEDAAILTSSRIVGRYSFSVPQAGYALHAVQNGRILFTVLTAFIFASIALVLSRWAERPAQPKETK